MPRIVAFYFGDKGEGKVEVLDGFALVGVGHLEIAVGGLDEGGVGEFAGLVFEGAKHGEVFKIGGDGEVKWGAAGGSVVVDEDNAAIAERDGVYVGVGVGDFEGAGLGPGDAEVVGVGDADADAGGEERGAGVEAEVFAAEGDNGWLDDAGGEPGFLDGGLLDSGAGAC